MTEISKENLEKDEMPVYWMGKTNRPAFPDISNTGGSFFYFISGLINMECQLHLVAVPPE